MDRFPFVPTAEEIRDLPFASKVIMPTAYARADAVPLTLVKDEFDEPSHYAANRTRALDTVAKVIRQHSLTLNGFEGQQQLVIDHLRNMIRIEKPDVAPIWAKVSSSDHFFHAISYMLLAFRMRDVTTYKSQADLRSTAFMFGSNVFEGGNVSLHQKQPATMPFF